MEKAQRAEPVAAHAVARADDPEQQSLLLKSDIETRRSTNQFGIIVWQLNEIWRECLPAPLA